MKRVHLQLCFRSALWVLILGSALCIFLFPDRMTIPLSAVFADTEAETVPTCRVEKESYTITIPADGEVTGLQSSSIQAPRTRTGALPLAWLVPEGTLVQAGETVLRFDNTDVKLSIETQQNTLAANRQRTHIALYDQHTQEKALAMDLTSANLEYEHLKSVIPEDETIFPKWDIIEAQIDAGLAKSKIDFLEQKNKGQDRIARSELAILEIEKNRAEAEMDLAEQALASLEVPAPVSGIVLYVRHRGQEPQIGDQCWPGQPLIEIVDPESLRAQIHVLERDAGGLKAGMEVHMQLDAFSDKTFKGTIESVAPVAQSLERNSPLRYFECDVSFGDKPDPGDVKPGMELRAEIVKKIFDSCVVLPSSAVTTKDTDHTVYVQEDTSFIPREVQTAAGPQGVTIVVDGIEEGETIALHNPFESRKLYLPDFGKATGNADYPPRPRRRNRHR